MGVSLLATVALCVGAGGVSAADCVVEVDPAVGPAGSIFRFTGSGFAPTELNLSKNGSPAGTHDLDPPTYDPGEVPVRSRPGDEGVWEAEFVADECVALAQFRVTLTNTDAAADLRAESSTPPVVAVLLLGAVALGGGLLLGRRLRPASGDNPPL